MSLAWAVARHMIAEAIRMKLALVFMALLGVVVVGLPFMTSGDSSLTGAVQNFLSHSLSAMGVLLGILTILLSRSLSDELVGRQIFLLATKPLPRWQFVLGKWLGMTVLNATFLLISGLAIYGMVHYIMATHPPLNDAYDEGELTHEVLVARHARKYVVPDFTKPAEVEYQRDLEEGVYQNRPDFNADEQRARLGRKIEAQWRVIGPQGAREFSFTSVLCDRSPTKVVHIRYKAEVSSYERDEMFEALWEFGDARKDTPVYRIRTRHMIGRFHTFAVPADAVATDHTLAGRFFNPNRYGNIMEFRKSEPIEVLFVVGSFEGNLFRTLILIQCKLMFLAAVALLAVTVFSFPVACLTGFTVYVLAATRSYITEALDMTAIGDYGSGWLGTIYPMLFWVVPDFAKFDGVETFVDGHNVGLVWVLRGIIELTLLRTTVVLGLAMLLFHRREVAEVSV